MFLTLITFCVKKRTFLTTTNMLLKVVSKMGIGPNEFTSKLQISNRLRGENPQDFPPPKESQGSGHFEAEVANETTHKFRVADQKILSDWIFDPFL